MMPTRSSRFRQRLDAFTRIEDFDNRLRRIHLERIQRENRRQTAAGNNLRDICSRRGCLQLSDLTDEDSLVLFRFTYTQIQELVVAFDLGDTITLRWEDVNHRQHIPSEVALAIMLRRLAFPARFSDLKLIFGYHKSDLCRIFNAMITRLHDKYAEGMTLDYHQFRPVNLGRFSRAIHFTGSPYEHCVGFIDGTFMRCARPIYDDKQRVLYNGHYRGHGFKFQAIVTPDGITSSLWGPITGNRHDAQMYGNSGMDDRLSGLFDMRERTGRHYHLYGDAAYANSTVMQRPYNRASANESQLVANRQMSSVRVCVENEFAHVTNLFAYLDFARTLRSGSSPITKTYVVATFMKNVHICMNGGNQTSRRFCVIPPSLDVYLSNLTRTRTTE